MLTFSLMLMLASVDPSPPPSAAGLAPGFVPVQQSLPGAQPTYEGWNRSQLEAELRRLEDARPSIGGQITMIALGGALGVIDLMIFSVGGLVALTTRSGFDPRFTIGISIVAVVAVGLLITGVILLQRAHKIRSAYSVQIDQVNEAIERQGQVPLKPQEKQEKEVPPAMLMPFPQVEMPAPLIAVTLARF